MDDKIDNWPEAERVFAKDIQKGMDEVILEALNAAPNPKTTVLANYGDCPICREFWRQHKALGQTIEALNLAIKGESMLKVEAGGRGSRGCGLAIGTTKSLNF